MSEPTKSELDLTGLDDRSTQKVLREVDMDELANALKGASDDIMAKIKRNMSKRAVGLLEEDMAELKPDDGAATRSAVERINNIINKLIDSGEMIRGKETQAVSPRSSGAYSVDTSSISSLRDTILSLSSKARDEGLLSLEGEIRAFEGDLLARGLQFVVDGTDPALARLFLQRTLESYEQLERLKIKEEIYRMEKSLADNLTRRRMILEGVLSIQRGDNLAILQDILDSF
jgi:hypothetical protein